MKWDLSSMYRKTGFLYIGIYYCIKKPKIYTIGGVFTAELQIFSCALLIPFKGHIFDATVVAGLE